MIESSYEEVYDKQWVKQNILISTNELVLGRSLFPWDKIIKRLLKFYDLKKGAIGKNLRMMVAILILMRFRDLSDRKIIAQIQENRYMQYYCNVPDDQLMSFVDHSTICKFRNRLGKEGVEIIEQEFFQHLRRSQAIKNDMSLTDSTVLESNMIYPTDVRLIFSAMKKMVLWSHRNSIPLWFTHKDVKKLWRTYHQDKNAIRLEYLQVFYDLFAPALSEFERLSCQKGIGVMAVLEAKSLLTILKILDEQTQLKLNGEIHIKDRLVSLDEVDARPIKKGKTFPACEFGTTNQMCFNRQGFMITFDLFIGAPKDKSLYQSTLDTYIKRMKGYPEVSVTDGGYRSIKNLQYHSDKINTIFMGKKGDVEEKDLNACLSARSATEGFIAVAKNLRGFGKSLYRGLRGDKIWATLNQIAYNLKKVIQLYNEETYEESVPIALGIWCK